MLILLLEALLALVLFILIIWWTMFSGRSKGELRCDQSQVIPADKAADEVAMKPAEASAKRPDET